MAFGCPTRWPLTVIMEIWEELHWRLIEEVKELIRLLKNETLTLAEIRFHALLPALMGRRG